MKGISMLDIILLPKSLYNKLTDNRFTLYPGILLVGVIDVIFMYIVNYEGIFTGKTQTILTLNYLIAFSLAIILGIIDVIFFSIPIFDLFKRFRKEEGAAGNSGQMIKVMKIYIIANFLIVPIKVLSYYLFRNADFGSRPDLVNLAVAIELITFVWFTAAITRGVNSIYRFEKFFKTLVFFVVYLWNYLLSLAFTIIMGNWMLKLFL